MLASSKDFKKSNPTWSVFRLAARRTAFSAGIPLLETARVSEKRVGPEQFHADRK
jgi:hypothetical protein